MAQDDSFSVLPDMRIGEDQAKYATGKVVPSKWHSMEYQAIEPTDLDELPQDMEDRSILDTAPQRWLKLELPLTSETKIAWDKHGS
jgi:hypothetical protein